MKYWTYRKPLLIGLISLSLPFLSLLAARHTQAQSPIGETSVATPNLRDLNIAELLREVENKGFEMHQQLSNYTYLLKKTRRVLDGHGKAGDKEMQEFEAYPARGEHVLIQLSKNGAPFSSPYIAWQRRRAGEDLEKAERLQNNLTGDQTQPAQNTEGYLIAGIIGKQIHLSIDPLTFLQACEFHSPRLEQVNNRDTFVLSFRSRPDASLPKNKAFVGKLVGAIWIDAVDKTLVRIDGAPAREFSIKALLPNSQEADAQLIYQQTRLADGAWFPTMIRLNAAANSAIFNGLNWDVVFEFSDYKRFKATAEDFKVSDKKNQF